MKMSEVADRLERLTPQLSEELTDKTWYLDRGQKCFFRLYVGDEYIDVDVRDAKNKTDDELRKLISDKIYDLESKVNATPEN